MTSRRLAVAGGEADAPEDERLSMTKSSQLVQKGGSMKRVLVAGAGGFIGGHLVKRLAAEGFWVRGMDLKQHEFSTLPADEFIIGLHLSRIQSARSRESELFRGLRLPCRARQRIRLGKAIQRAFVPCLHANTASLSGSRVFTISSVQKAPGRAGGRKRPPRFAARSLKPRTAVPSKSGAMANRHGRFSTSTNAPKAYAD